MVKVRNERLLRLAVIVSLAIAAAMIALYQHLASQNFEAETRREIQEIHQILVSSVLSHGTIETSEHIREAVAASEATGDGDVFLLQSANGVSIAGNVSNLVTTESWHSQIVAGTSFLGSQFRHRDRSHGVIGLGKTLKNGDYLFVGYDVDEHHNAALLRNAIVWIAFAAAVSTLYFTFSLYGKSQRMQLQNLYGLFEGKGLAPTEQGRHDYVALVEAAAHLVERQEKEKSKLSHSAAVAAHDLRTPLARLQMDLARIGNEVSSGQQLSDEISHIAGEVEKLIWRFDSVVYLSKVNLRQEALEIRVADVANALQAVFDLYEPMVEECGCSISWGKFEPVFVKANIDDLQRMFGNIIENAYQHNVPGTHIEVSCFSSELEARVEVADNGAGISDDLRQQIIRGDTTKSGFGWPIVLALAKSNTIQVELFNNKPGLCVVFHIPRAGSEVI